MIVSVEGDSIAGLDSEVATAKIKGPEGTEVTIGVLDPKSGKAARADDRPAPRSRCRW